MSNAKLWAPEPEDSKRAQARIVPNLTEVVWVGDKGSLEQFNPNNLGLIVSESISGCSFVTVKEPTTKEGDGLTIAIGKSEPVNATVKWIKILAPHVWQIGCALDVKKA